MAAITKQALTKWN